MHANLHNLSRYRCQYILGFLRVQFRTVKTTERPRAFSPPFRVTTGESRYEFYHASA